MNINNLSSRLRLYAKTKSYQHRSVKKAQSSANESENIQLNTERRYQKDRRQRNIRVLLNRRRIADRRRLRSAPAKEHNTDNTRQGSRINTRA